MSTWGQINLMDPASPIQMEMMLFHDHAMAILIGIFTLVSLLGVKLCFNTLSTRTMHEAQLLETLWTILPAFLLVWLALPSLRLLYLLDEQGSEGIILKAIGHQWYWSYEMPSMNISNFDSYMIPEEDLKPGDYRLLEVDNRPMVPYGLDINVITTSADVIHAWALPSMGVKMDAVPGRLNSMGFHANLPGIYYGQCSEICGANHSFMPITVEAIDVKDFIKMCN
uniref:Cytochrome c oxidase subunit 2 n=1 Tax=Albinaria caerulea TaxID=42349 RepID=COX2_ALBCA|nr:cytochrome c oxidase subunit II [Albinaria caerulea]P48889.1 RecName: Full=Cytochrome c oxidase subunit 2; AltName: Full=Cytochrome c oxidase polypeptide II [Albinaria caerulea]CAA58300.1 COII [Albinaria caerulea]